MSSGIGTFSPQSTLYQNLQQSPLSITTQGWETGGTTDGKVGPDTWFEVQRDWNVLDTEGCSEIYQIIMF